MAEQAAFRFSQKNLTVSMAGAENNKNNKE
jgi:hypothetical protein